MNGSKNKNEEVLASFSIYCHLHPEERFWQALRNWSGHAFIFAGNLQPKTPDGVLVAPRDLTVEELIGLVESFGLKDTFYAEEKKSPDTDIH